MIAIILVNWNGHEDTVECLEALMRLDNNTSSFRIIISDNSPDRTSLNYILDWCAGKISVDLTSPVWTSMPLERCHQPDYKVWDGSQPGNFLDAPLITIIHNGENLGFAGGNNVGIRLALTNPKVDNIWLLNNDTVCRPDSLDHLERRMIGDQKLGVLGSTLVYYDQPTKAQGLGGWFDGRRGWGDHIGKFASLNSLPQKVDVEKKMTYVIGASMLVRREFIQDIGIMSEYYFLYFEEMDWSERNAGRFLMGWEPHSVVYHKEGSSIGTSTRVRSSDTSIYYFNRNLLFYTWNYHPRSIIIVFLRIITRIMRFIFQIELRAALVVIEAVRDFLLGRSGRRVSKKKIRAFRFRSG